MSDNLPTPDPIEIEHRLEQVERAAEEDAKDLKTLKERVAVLEGCLDPLIKAMIAIPILYGDRGTITTEKSPHLESLYAAINHLNEVVRPKRT